MMVKKHNDRTTSHGRKRSIIIIDIVETYLVQKQKEDAIIKNTLEKPGKTGHRKRAVELNSTSPFCGEGNRGSRVELYYQKTLLYYQPIIMTTFSCHTIGFLRNIVLVLTNNQLLCVQTRDIN